MSVPTTMTQTDLAYQQCINPACRATYAVDQTIFACPTCGDLLDVVYDWDRLPVPSRLNEFEAKWSTRLDPLNFSGVWRFRELLPFAPREMVVTVGEGQTLLQSADKVAQYVGMTPGNLKLQYEGMNPSGSFKDNGMTAAFTHARMVGARRVACASTGNTSAALAVYCSATDFGFKAIIFIGSGKIAYGKLAQALDHGALTIQIVGDFDDAMHRVRQVADRLGIYLMNSVNPFRLEGQKTIMYRVLEGLGWEVPDWIVVPGGNLGNSSAFGKAFIELKHLGLIDRVPRLAVINAAGARTLEYLVSEHNLTWRDGLPDMAASQTYYDELDAKHLKASTIASAIEINRPVNLKKCLRALDFCQGVVRQVSDQEIMDAKARVGSGGLGCEPASAASVAGAKKLREEGIIAPSDRVVCILTGHQLKDPTATVAYHGTDQENFEKVLGSRGVHRAGFANRPVVVPNDLDDIIRTIALYSDAGSAGEAGA
ncbi:threonine synthase [Singulisphaera acidiphila]|uniref:Threonine synthase n=1 Tax=Singulisphaera acidiphila (strain ATCC BAA-1392 / DSM 18658 / VKM B-2454 / MOB10) TaxID=886293 RepID=L0DIA3_SINAD|nr:threonine synthase [Singulisphaera acidiphila]AGA28987.1 threonine synthase [Singulisphaera acidiphila DSM 18658]